jgi:hypothetical protein
VVVVDVECVAAVDDVVPSAVVVVVGVVVADVVDEEWASVDATLVGIEARTRRRVPVADAGVAYVVALMRRVAAALVEHDAVRSESAPVVAPQREWAPVRWWLLPERQ